MFKWQFTTNISISAFSSGLACELLAPGGAAPIAGVPDRPFTQSIASCHLRIAVGKSPALKAAVASALHVTHMIYIILYYILYIYFDL